MGPPSAPTIAGLILTGGASRRMGRDKATLVVGGRRCADRVASALRLSVTGPVLEVGPGHTDLPRVAEPDAGQGPLAALAAGAAALTEGGYHGAALVTACDLPLITPELLRFLAERSGTAVPMVAGHPQPLCARYDEHALRSAGALWAEGARAMRALLDAVDVEWLDERAWSAVASPDTFADVDTPEDLARLGLV